MNYLALVNRAKRECGVVGSDLTTLATQSTEINRLAAWVNTAWMDVQESHDDWFYLRSTLAFASTALQFSYTAAQMGIAASPGLGNFKRDSMRIYSPSLGLSNEMVLPFVPYDDFLQLYQFGTMRTTYTRPVVFSIDPQRNFVLGATPDAIYNVNGEFYVAPSELVADTDTPVLTTRYHMLIVYGAMMHYGQYESAREVYQRGKMEFDKMMSRLNGDQLPDMTFGPSLA